MLRFQTYPVLLVALGLQACTAAAPTYDYDGDGTADALDCNPEDPEINPSATDIYPNGIDENCDGVDGNDNDGDGFAGEALDCNDSNPLVHPNSVEICNDGIDNDCDPETSDLCDEGDDDDSSDEGDDDDTAPTDADGDGIESALDCDDDDPSLGALAQDADCDGVITNDDCDDNDPTTVEDMDCDGVLTNDDCDDNDNESTVIAEDADCDGVLTNDDCDDNDNESTVITEDTDCDGVITNDDCDDTDHMLSAFNGTSSTCPGLSCLDLLENGFSTGTGSYWIDPDDDGAGAFEVTCDMISDNGGWTQVAELENTTAIDGFLADFAGMEFSQIMAVYGSEWLRTPTQSNLTVGTWGTCSGYTEPCISWPSFTRWDGGNSHTLFLYQDHHAENGNFGGFFSHCNAPFGPGFGFSQASHCTPSSQLFWNAIPVNGPVVLYLR